MARDYRGNIYNKVRLLFYGFGVITGNFNFYHSHSLTERSLMLTVLIVLCESKQSCIRVCMHVKQQL